MPEYSSHNISAMIDSMMSKSRSDHSEKFELIDLNEIIRCELAFLQANMFFKHDVEKIIMLSPGNLPVYAVPAMIGQVFTNLVQKSLDAWYEMPRPHLIVSTCRNYEYIHLSVEDNGLGIPEEHLPYIFDPFYVYKSSIINNMSSRQNGNSGKSDGIPAFLCHSDANFPR